MAENIVAEGQATDTYGSLEMVKLKAEKTRTYIFAEGESTFENVTHLAVSKRGTHRLRTHDGKFHIVRCGWLAISLDLPEGWTL